LVSADISPPHPFPFSLAFRRLVAMVAVAGEQRGRRKREAKRGDIIGTRCSFEVKIRCDRRDKTESALIVTDTFLQDYGQGRQAGISR